ncbi:DUF3016 domain-containing protein [Bowmanella yangjiangensis]|uniref:DUF3016 domain-containing protein n=1 Tax=Bowmanella yangjiangensis TaxID=2811230 RepID=A0ABS3D0S0_9ALTE|nr:DUF3016 domain-containing protein [Bowmanella yangjiangensis]MBN7821484.1 DUF3016 domain-containing protein [Bowmanella yangjiangensis]
MKNATRSLLMAAALLGVSGVSWAKADVEINWQDPERYTDVHPANESRVNFRERTFADIQKYMEKLAEKLPDGQKLQMNVTNVDLAGQVWPGSFVGLDSPSDVRLIKRIDIPRMKFDYKLLDANGQQLKGEEVDLKDMSFQDRVNPLFNSESLRYEKNMLRDWFNEAFAEFLPKKDDK